VASTPAPISVRSLLRSLVLAGALGAAACRDRGATSPCTRTFPDVARTIDVAWPAPSTRREPLATLHVAQRHADGIDGGCPTAVPIALRLARGDATPVAFSYRITWSDGGGGWLREGTVARLAADAPVDLAPVDDAPPFDDGTLTVVATEGRALTIGLTRAPGPCAAAGLGAGSGASVGCVVRP
jgi:hypothetical protein